MPKQPEIQAGIRRGLAFLEKNQRPDGSFISYSSAAMQPFRRVRSWQTTFVPALMLTALAGSDQAAARNISAKLAKFLLRQKDPNWSFNYWAKNAPEYQTQPYPNDLDDTFCALAGLYLHDPDSIDEAALVQIIKLLLATETDVGGPYRTWLVPADSEQAWLDVDIAVNSNIAYFLLLVSSRLPKLDKLIGDAIDTGRFSSPYYTSDYAFVYYFARAYDGPHAAKLLKMARRLHKAATTDLDRALCLSARLRLHETRDVSETVRDLLAGQRHDGSWAAAAFYADPVKNNKLYYNGGPALTTAFILEALALYADASETASTGDAEHGAAMAPLVVVLAESQCGNLESGLRATILRLLDTLTASDSGPEITALSQRFNQSLAKPLKPAADDFLAGLSLANAYGWLAYTVYDDFLDGTGKPSLLPAANTAMRKSFDGFSEAVPKNPAFRALVREVFDAIDSANAWEQGHCRFATPGGQLSLGTLPDYDNLSKLADRSLGHTLAPLAILAAKGLRVSDTPFQKIRSALFHYLIARQLNDDLHDWQTDLDNGHISYVVSRVLADLRLRPGKYAMPALLAKAQRQFWHASLPVLCQEVEAQITLSRQAFNASGLLTENNVIAQLLDRLEQGIHEAMDRRREAVNFLKHYNEHEVLHA